MVGGSGQVAPVGEAFSLSLLVAVTDAGGNPVPGVVVAFAAPATGASATLSAASATTDAAGTFAVRRT